MGMEPSPQRCPGTPGNRPQTRNTNPGGPTPALFSGPRMADTAQRGAQVTLPSEWSLARRPDQAAGSLAHFCPAPSAGGSPRRGLLSEGRKAEPVPQPSPLSTGLSLLLLGAQGRASEELGAQASLSKD